jgi:glucans biosynthesis protein
VRKFVIDFQGPAFQGLDRNSGVAFDVAVSRGQAANVYCHPVVGQAERWRAIFDLVASGPAPVDMRGYLKRGEQALSETWVYQYFPEA